MADENKVNQLLEHAPLPRMIENMGKSIAVAQFELDKYAIQIMREAGKKDDGNGVEVSGKTYSLLELGLLPSFYHFSETRLSAKVAFSMMRSREVGFEVGASVSAGFGPFGMVSASVNASYSNKYSFKSEGSSEVNTKLVTVPPPTQLVDIINQANADNSS